MADPEPPPEAAPEASEHLRQRQAMPQLFVSTPYVSWLGMVVERYEPDLVTMRLPFRHDLTNDGRNYHGGVVSSALDTAGGLAAFSNHDFGRGVKAAATISLSVQFVAGAGGADLVCHARAVRRARELIFTEITASDADGRVLAHAVQTYRIA